MMAIAIIGFIITLGSTFMLGTHYAITNPKIRNKILASREPEIRTEIETVPKFLSPPEVKTYYRLKPIMGGMKVEEVKIDTIIQYEGESYLTTKKRFEEALFNSINTYFKQEFDSKAIDFVNLYIYHGLDKSRVVDQKVLENISEDSNIQEDFHAYGIMGVVLRECSEDITTLHDTREDAENERLDNLLDTT